MELKKLKDSLDGTQKAIFLALKIFPQNLWGVLALINTQISNLRTWPILVLNYLKSLKHFI